MQAPLHPKRPVHSSVRPNRGSKSKRGFVDVSNCLRSTWEGHERLAKFSTRTSLAFPGPVWEVQTCASNAQRLRVSGSPSQKSSSWPGVSRAGQPTSNSHCTGGETAMASQALPTRAKLTCQPCVPWLWCACALRSQRVRLRS